MPLEVMRETAMTAQTDLQRVVEKLRRGAPTRQGFATLWRQQQPSLGASAEDCVRRGRNPERKFDPLRRRQGKLRTA